MSVPRRDPAVALLDVTQATVAGTVSRAVLEHVGPQLAAAVEALERDQYAAAHDAIDAIPAWEANRGTYRRVRAALRDAFLGGLSLALDSAPTGRPPEEVELALELYMASVTAGVQAGRDNARRYLSRLEQEERDQPVARGISVPAALRRRADVLATVEKVDPALADNLNDVLFGRAKLTVDIGANLTTSRLISYGYLDGLNQRAVQRYRLKAVLDSRTSQICRRMHGREFEVDVAREWMRSVLHLTDPEDLKTAAPFWPSNQDGLRELETLTNAELQQRGMMVPPFHPHCRTIVVHVNTEVGQADFTPVSGPGRTDPPPPEPEVDDFPGAAAYHRLREPDPPRNRDELDLPEGYALRSAQADARLALNASTAEQYRAAGLWAPERLTYQVNTAAAMLRAADPIEERVLEVLSGRGVAQRRGTGATLNVDLRDIQAAMPEAEPWNRLLLHEEASRIMHMVLAAARARGLKVTVPLTLADEASLSVVQPFLEAGYALELEHVFTTIRAAAQASAGLPYYMPVEAVLTQTATEAVFDDWSRVADFWRFRDPAAGLVHSGPGAFIRRAQGEEVPGASYELVPGVNIPLRRFRHDPEPQDILDEEVQAVLEGV